jgi:hypothetical protein
MFRPLNAKSEKFVVGSLEYAIEDRPHPPKPRKLACLARSIFGSYRLFDCTVADVLAFSMQLLADQLISLGIVDSISDETVRQTLKKTLV